MSTAAPAAEAPVPAKGKKKLIIIIVAAAVVLLGGGGTAVFLMKKGAADAEAAAVETDGEGHAPAKGAKAVKAARHDSKDAPVFVPLDPFTVNLADRDAERYAQIGITLEIDDSHTGDRIKSYMPAIRNNILMAIADRTAGELMGREGKARLAEKIVRETSRAIGVEVDADEPEAAGEQAEPKPAKKKKAKSSQVLPITAVHFSNFIIQ